MQGLKKTDLSVLAIYGSPRKDGFSSSLHNDFLGPFVSAGFVIHKIYPYDMKINPCIACGACRVKPSCIFQDDMTQIYDLIRFSSVVSISMPLYFSSFPSPLKALMDRCQVIWEEVQRDGSRYKDRSGFLISTGGSVYDNMFAGVLTGLKHFFNSTNISFFPENSILYSGVDAWDKISLDISEKTRIIGAEFLQKNLNL